jgi:3-oxocholest-4-en-26-oate---CoA ligase
MALNFADLFEHAADAFAERTAVACGDRRVTYRELDERTNRLAHHLAGVGVGPGDHVGLYARNSIEAIETLIASCKLRAAAVNINYRYVENELQYMLADSDLTALVYDRRLAPVVQAARAAAPGLRGLVEIDDGTPAQAAEPAANAANAPATRYDAALAAASPERDFPPRSADDVYVIYTGGTTGAREVWLAIQRHRVNVLVIIGDAMARPLIEAYAEGDYDASSLVAVSSSAALFSPAVKDACAKALPGAVITEAIGSTETGFAGISFVSAGQPHRGGPTVMAGPDVVVLGDDGGVAAPGQVGLLARGGHVPLGYYKDPERTAQMFAEVNGRRYAVPGDMARVEEDGTVTLLGRGHTCVNTGGEKVFPEEVESVLKSHPDVFDALVIGVPDGRLGQRVAALVQLRPGAATGPGQLQEHVRGQLAGYKVPRSIWLAEAIRRTVSGKADYAWARAYADDHEPALSVAR